MPNDHKSMMIDANDKHHMQNIVVYPQSLHAKIYTHLLSHAPVVSAFNTHEYINTKKRTFSPQITFFMKKQKRFWPKYHS